MAQGKRTPRKLTPLAGAIASALVLGFATPVSGQSTTTTQPGATSTQRSTGPAHSPAITRQAASMSDQRASELIGRVVRNAEGDDLGRLRDFAVDMSNKRIHFAIVSHGGVLGIGDKDVAVPVSRLQAGTRDREVVLNMTKEQLKEAPELERSVKWSDPRTWDNIGQHYHGTLGMAASEPAAPTAGGQAPAQTAGSAPSQVGTWPSRTEGLLRASDVIGMDVLDSSGTEIGEIEDLVVDFSSGNVHYAVLEFDRRWNPNDKLVALPVDSFRLTSDGKDLTINRTREQIANAPSFDRREWPALSEFRGQVSRWNDSTIGMDNRRTGTAATTGTAGSSSSQANATAGSATPQSGASDPSRGATSTQAQSGTSASETAAARTGTPLHSTTGTQSGGTSQSSATTGSDTSATGTPSASDGSSTAGASGSTGMGAQGSGSATTGTGTTAGSATTTDSSTSGSTTTSSTTPGSSPAGSGTMGSDTQGGASTVVSSSLNLDASEFSRLDTNGDGRLNRDEARAHSQLSSQWSTIDRDGDGYISRDELDAARRNGGTTSATAGSPSSSTSPAPGSPSTGTSPSGATSPTTQGAGSGTQPR